MVEKPILSEHDVQPAEEVKVRVLIFTFSFGRITFLGENSAEIELLENQSRVKIARSLTGDEARCFKVLVEQRAEFPNLERIAVLMDIDKVKARNVVSRLHRNLMITPFSPKKSSKGYTILFSEEPTVTEVTKIITPPQSSQ